MSEESPSVHKLPLEVMGLILLKLDNPERQFEEIKKCRLISPRWYKAVQDIFQDQFFQKGLAHFDGLKYTYGQSRRFGLNIFGSFRLNFTIFKISNSELYLMNNLLARLASNNLQNLILQDNQLNMKELLEVLKMFPNIVKLELIQSSKDIKVAEKICQLYANPDDKSDIETIEMIKKELAGTENFLQNLKKIDLKIVHASVLNFVILIISCGECELEELSIEFDIIGIIESIKRSKSIQANEVDYKNFSIGPITQLNKFSKSLKKIKITANPPSMSPLIYLGTRYWIFQTGISRVTQSIFNIFNGNQLSDLKNIEELQINMRHEQFNQNETGLLNFIKNQNSLTKVDVGIISELFGSIHSQTRGVRVQLKTTFLESLRSLGVKFGCEISEFGLDSISQFSENLTRLEINICMTTFWRLSDNNEINFPNCQCLTVKYACSWGENNDHWPNFEVPVIVKKFPNLKNLEFQDWDFFSRTKRPQISNEDLQIIIKNYPNLEKLSLISCIQNLDDSGMTGLTYEALKLRKNSPYLPLTHEERPGLPISHLKNLVELLLFKNNLVGPHITNLTPTYGFEYQAPKLKSFSFGNTKITDSGIDLLKKKLPSNCRLRKFSRHLPFDKGSFSAAIL